MKKLLMAIVVIMAGVMSCYAADAAEESAQRIANLEKILKKVPGSTGVADLDQYVSAAAKAGTQAVANSVIIKSVTDGNITPDALKALADGLKAEKEALEEAGKLAPKAAEGLKSVKPMQLPKAKKAIDFASTCTTVVTQESIYQAQVLAELTK